MPCIINIFGMRSNAQTSSETASTLLHWLKRAQRSTYQLKAPPRLKKTCAFPSIPCLALVQTCSTLHQLKARPRLKKTCALPSIPCLALAQTCSTLHVSTQSATEIAEDLRIPINPLPCFGSHVLNAPHTNSKRHQDSSGPSRCYQSPLLFWFKRARRSSYQLKAPPRLEKSCGFPRQTRVQVPPESTTGSSQNRFGWGMPDSK